MAEYVKEINGHKYRYEEYWDKAEKRVKWRYLGKVDDSAGHVPKSQKDALKMAFSALYEKCKAGGYGVQFDPRQLRRLRMHINEVLKEYSM